METQITLNYRNEKNKEEKIIFFDDGSFENKKEKRTTKRKKITLKEFESLSQSSPPVLTALIFPTTSREMVETLLNEEDQKTLNWLFDIMKREGHSPDCFFIKGIVQTNGFSKYGQRRPHGNSTWATYPWIKKNDNEVFWIEWKKRKIA